MRTTNEAVTLLKLLAAAFFVLAVGFPAAAQVVITPSTPPIVNQGATFQFTANVPVRWSMAPGAKGTIDPVSGSYTAPAVVVAQQSYAGCPVLPNDHIYNTRIDSLPVNPDSAAWIASAGSSSFRYEIGLPVNILDPETPAQNMSFYYTPVNNGLFLIPQYPTARIESGWFTAPFGGGDRHLLSVDPTTCTFEDVYDPYPAGANTQCSSCTAQSGVKYSGLAYGLALHGGTDAAGLYITPLLLKLQELENALATGGTINHALRFTLNQGYCASANIWPAQTFATDGGTVPFGARFRLKASFDISSFSPIAKILLTQLKQYGIILSDGGTGWAVQPEDTRWPAAYQKAFSEIYFSGIKPSEFEAVDESVLEISPTSGVTKSAETVVATSTSNDKATASQQVVLTGITLNLPKDQVYIQAGAPTTQLTAYTRGPSKLGGVTWSMNPQLGTITSGGAYTPAVSSSSALTTTVTATSEANPDVFATMLLTVLPNGTIYIVNGQTNPYMDTLGHVWQPMTGDDGGHPYDNGGSWPSLPDMILYKTPYYSWGGDMRFDIIVPDGRYSIAGKFASTNINVPGQLVSLESQGQVLYQNIDIYTQSGGNNRPIDFTLPANVSNGLLSFVLRHVAGSYNDISALQITPLSLSPGSDRPTPPIDLRATVN